MSLSSSWFIFSVIVIVGLIVGIILGYGLEKAAEMGTATPLVSNGVELLSIE